MWKTLWSLPHLETPQPHQKNNIWWYQGGFLGKEENSFHHVGKILNYLHLKDSLKYKCEMYLKQPLTSPQHKVLVAYHTSNRRLAIEIGWWSTIPISRDTRLCHLCSYNAIDTEAPLLVLECLLYNPIKDNFPSLFDNVVLGSLKYIFQLADQVDIRATSHTRPKAVTIATYEVSLAERAEIVQVHFTHEGEGLKAQRRLHGWKVYMESYMADYR